MLKITYYPDTYERVRETVPIDQVPPQYRCTPGSRFVGRETNFTEMAGDIVAAFVQNNSVAASDLPNIIKSVHGSLCAIDAKTVKDETSQDIKTPSQIKKSIETDNLISFIDGKRYKAIKRHLKSHGLDMEAYRARFGLPRDYPSVAPSYSAKRSKLAKTLGLGRGLRGEALQPGQHEAGTTTSASSRSRSPRS